MQSKKSAPDKRKRTDVGKIGEGAVGLIAVDASAYKHRLDTRTIEEGLEDIKRAKLRKQAPSPPPPSASTTNNTSTSS